MANKGKFLANLKLENGRNVSFRASEHGWQRMMERNIDTETVVGSILTLGSKIITELQASNEEAIVIDETNNIAIVVNFQKNSPNTIRVVTVIAKANVYVRQGTRIERI